VRGVEVGADVPVELLGRDRLGHPGRLRLGPAVHPDHRGSERPAVGAAHDHPVQLRPERDALHGGRTSRHLREEVPDAGHGRRRPGVGVLLGRAGERE
jgi:hypothetical protein